VCVLSCPQSPNINFLNRRPRSPLELQRLTEVTGEADFQEEKTPDPCVLPHVARLSAMTIGRSIWRMCLRLLVALLLLSLTTSNTLVVFARQTEQLRIAAPGPQEGPTEADLEEELRQTREQLRSSPQFAGTDADAHLRFAQVLHHRGDLTGATEEYQAAITLNPELTEAYRGLGVLFIDRHDWMRAVKALTITTQRRPEDAEAFYWLGRAHMARGNWKDASGALASTIRLKPDDAEAYADLGLVRMVQGNVADAAEALRKAVSLKPDDADAHSLLETVLAHQHHPEQVTSAARQVLNTRFARE
jgi:cytochrome c-type biogenesis protein CcmH/NrfG